MLLRPLPSSPLVPKLAADRIGILDTAPLPQALRVSMYHSKYRERLLFLKDFLFPDTHVFLYPAGRDSPGNARSDGR